MRWAWHTVSIPDQPSGDLRYLQRVCNVLVSDYVNLRMRMVWDRDLVDQLRNGVTYKGKRRKKVTLEVPR